MFLVSVMVSAIKRLVKKKIPLYKIQNTDRVTNTRKITVVLSHKTED